MKPAAFLEQIVRRCAGRVPPPPLEVLSATPDSHGVCGLRAEQVDQPTLLLGPGLDSMRALADCYLAGRESGLPRRTALGILPVGTHQAAVVVAGRGRAAVVGQGLAAGVAELVRVYCLALRQGPEQSVSSQVCPNELQAWREARVAAARGCLPLRLAMRVCSVEERVLRNLAQLLIMARTVELLEEGVDQRPVLNRRLLPEEDLAAFHYSPREIERADRVALRSFLRLTARLPRELALLAFHWSSAALSQLESGLGHCWLAGAESESTRRLAMLEWLRSHGTPSGAPWETRLLPFPEVFKRPAEEWLGPPPSPRPLQPLTVAVWESVLGVRPGQAEQLVDFHQARLDESGEGWAAVPEGTDPWAGPLSPPAGSHVSETNG